MDILDILNIFGPYSVASPVISEEGQVFMSSIFEPEIFASTIIDQHDED